MKEICTFSFSQSPHAAAQHHIFRKEAIEVFVRHNNLNHKRTTEGGYSHDDVIISFYKLEIPVPQGFRVSAIVVIAVPSLYHRRRINMYRYAKGKLQYLPFTNFIVMKNNLITQNVNKNIESVGGRALALTCPSAYLDVSDEDKQFRIELTTSWPNPAGGERSPLLYDFKKRELKHDNRNRTSENDCYDPAVVPEIYGSRKEADAIFDTIIKEKNDAFPLNDRSDIVMYLQGICLVGRTSDGLEAVEREWTVDPEYPYNMVRRATDLRELARHFEVASLDELLQGWEGPEIHNVLALGDFGDTTIGGVLKIFERREIYSIEELRWAANQNESSAADTACKPERVKRKSSRPVEITATVDDLRKVADFVQKCQWHVESLQSIIDDSELDGDVRAKLEDEITILTNVLEWSATGLGCIITPPPLTWLSFCRMSDK